MLPPVEDSVYGGDFQHGSFSYSEAQAILWPIAKYYMSFVVQLILLIAFWDV
jgi:hypothetical protein